MAVCPGSSAGLSFRVLNGDRPASRRRAAGRTCSTWPDTNTAGHSDLPTDAGVLRGILLGEDFAPMQTTRGCARSGLRALRPTRRRGLLLFVRLLAGAGQTPWTRRWHASAIHEPRPPAPPCARQAEAQVVVAVARRVPVAIRRPAVPGVVVPAAAAFHPVRA